MNPDETTPQLPTPPNPGPQPPAGPQTPQIVGVPQPAPVGAVNPGTVPLAPESVYQPPPPERINAFAKNLVFLWEESLILTGLPIELLINQVFKNAAQRGLAATGEMLDYGRGPSFTPTKDTLQVWVADYFTRVLSPAVNDMPEA